jgi:hypothetical protein
MVALLAATAAGVAYAVVTLRAKRELALETADSIQSELDALDPITRAAVVAKLSSDAARDHKSGS